MSLGIFVWILVVFDKYTIYKKTSQLLLVNINDDADGTVCYDAVCDIPCDNVICNKYVFSLPFLAQSSSNHWNFLSEESNKVQRRKEPFVIHNKPPSSTT